MVDPVADDLFERFAERDVQYTDWAGWLKLNDHELALGAADKSPIDRERVKVVDREEMVDVSRS